VSGSPSNRLAVENEGEGEGGGGDGRIEEKEQALEGGGSEMRDICDEVGPSLDAHASPHLTLSFFFSHCIYFIPFLSFSPLRLQDLIFIKSEARWPTLCLDP
jgi:hypothetical protein